MRQHRQVLAPRKEVVKCGRAIPCVLEAAAALMNTLESGRTFYSVHANGWVFKAAVGRSTEAQRVALSLPRLVPGSFHNSYIDLPEVAWVNEFISPQCAERVREELSSRSKLNFGGHHEGGLIFTVAVLQNLMVADPEDPGELIPCPAEDKLELLHLASQLTELKAEPGVLELRPDPSLHWAPAWFMPLTDMSTKTCMRLVEYSRDQARALSAKAVNAGKLIIYEPTDIPEVTVTLNLDLFRAYADSIKEGRTRPAQGAMLKSQWIDPLSKIPGQSVFNLKQLAKRASKAEIRLDTADGNQPPPLKRKKGACTIL